MDFNAALIMKDRRPFEKFLGEEVQHALRKYEATEKVLDSEILLRSLIAARLCELARNPRVKFVPRFTAKLGDHGVIVKFDREDLAKLDEHWKNFSA